MGLYKWEADKIKACKIVEHRNRSLIHNTITHE